MRPKSYLAYMARLVVAGIAFFVVGVSNMLDLGGPLRWALTGCLGCAFAICLSQTPLSGTLDDRSARGSGEENPPSQLRGGKRHP